MPFLILFVLIPFVEISIFLSVSDEIGLLTTLALTFLTAIIGGGLVRQQGVETIHKLQSNLRSGTMPVQEIFDGACLIAAGAMLITPGFLTDIIGFTLLIPQARRALRQIIGKKMTVTTSASAYTRSNKKHHYHSSNDNPKVIDAEFEEIKDDHK